jgi:hypothetical protein
MALYIALHTLKKSPDDINNAWPELAPKFAKAQAAGENPAKCIKTWNPLPYGRKDYMFCLWEADKPEDIKTSLGKWLDYLTVDNMQVDEVDWAEYVKTL